LIPDDEDSDVKAGRMHEEDTSMPKPDMERPNRESEDLEDEK
jgi:hypothetical protein